MVALSEIKNLMIVLSSQYCLIVEVAKICVLLQPCWKNFFHFWHNILSHNCHFSLFNEVSLILQGTCFCNNLDKNVMIYATFLLVKNDLVDLIGLIKNPVVWRKY